MFASEAGLNGMYCGELSFLIFGELTFDIIENTQLLNFKFFGYFTKTCVFIFLQN